MCQMTSEDIKYQLNNNNNGETTRQQHVYYTLLPGFHKFWNELHDVIEMEYNSKGMGLKLRS